MATGRSLHIGLNTVDPRHYQGWDGKLVACEADAKDMLALAKARGFATSQLMLTKECTAAAVQTAIGEAAKALQPGDLFFLTYSGHGGRVPDKNGDETDGRDETWVLYDRQLVDDELYALWHKFRAGVRIIVLSDSCHSGTNIRAPLIEAAQGLPGAAELGADPSAPRFRGVPDTVRDVTYRANQALYDEIQQTVPDGEKLELGASIMLISGCQDNQLSADGDRNGLFTGTLLKVWNDGRFRGRYRRFHQRIVERMPPWQSPNLYLVGAPSPAFERQSPFSI